MSSIVEVKNVSKVYSMLSGIYNINLEIRQGDIVGIIGKNGAGKTTLLKILAGLITEYEGEIKYADIRKGGLIENTGYHPQLNAIENLKMVNTLLNQTFKDEDLHSILELFQIHSLDKVKNFSIGMKQKLGLAIAIMGAPELVLLDEPTSALDSHAIINFKKMIHQLNIEKKITFVISSHDLQNIMSVVNKIVILDKGHLITVLEQEQL